MRPKRSANLYLILFSSSSPLFLMHLFILPQFTSFIEPFLLHALFHKCKYIRLQYNRFPILKAEEQLWFALRFGPDSFTLWDLRLAIPEEIKSNSLEDGKQTLNPWNKRDPISKPYGKALNEFSKASGFCLRNGTVHYEWTCEWERQSVNAGLFPEKSRTLKYEGTHT